MATMQVFLSHSSVDKDVAERVAVALRGAGADVWFDEHNLGATQLLDGIQRQLAARPVFVVLLSKAAFASDWVKRECKWAFNIQLRDPSHIILPVVISPIDPNALESDALTWRSTSGSKAPHNTPYPEAEMLERTLRLLALTPAGQAAAVGAPQPTESVDDLMTQGRALAAQKRWAEALPFFQRATERDPNNASAWGELGRMLNELKRYAEALAAYDRSLALDHINVRAWNNKGVALDTWGAHEEALVAYDRALALDPNYAAAWYNKGVALDRLRRHEEALVAYDRALALDPNNVNAWIQQGQRAQPPGAARGGAGGLRPRAGPGPRYAAAWYNKGVALDSLGRYEEALAAYDRALALELKPGLAAAWRNKGVALDNLGRYEEAIGWPDNRALGLDPGLVDAWYNKGNVLFAAWGARGGDWLAYDKALELDPNHVYGPGTTRASRSTAWAGTRRRWRPA